jgi:thiol-disulfide isomerase/thioredoxin
LNAAVLIVRIGLAAMFAVAGTAKLRDRGGTRTAAHEFGVPVRFAPAVAWILPLAELTSAVLLVFAPTAAVGAALGLVLLVVFTTAIAVALARGRKPDCHCFGQLHSSPAGAATLVRNACLIALAAFALAGSLSGHTTSVVAWVGRLNDSQRLALAVAVAALVVSGAGAAAFFTLLRSYGKVLVRLDRVEAAFSGAGIDLADEEPPAPVFGLEPGTEAPAFPALPDLLAPGKPLLLLFTSTSCGPCHDLLPAAARWQREHAEKLTVAFACEGTPEAVRAEASEFELDHVVADESSRLYEHFQANGTPGAVLIAENGRIASRVAAGAEQIGRLVESAVSPPPSYGLGIGEPAPELELELIDGASSPLSAFRGRETLLLFWNPSCGFCRTMHERVLEWEGSAGASSPRLVVISSGDPDETQAEGFSSMVVLDRNYAVGEAFGAGGTPMGALLDAGGRMAAPLAAGEDAVFALAGERVGAA